MWYSIEGAERLNELSRQLRTFLNFKKSLIHLRFSKSEIYTKNSDIEQHIKYKSELINSMSRMITLLKDIRIEDDKISEKIQKMLEESRISPRNADLNKIKEIKSLNYNIWKFIHILSELENHKRPRFLETVLNVSSILCEISAPFFLPFSRFYYELKTNYLLLDNELLSILNIKNNHQLPSSKNKIGVKIAK